MHRINQTSEISSSVLTSLGLRQKVLASGKTSKARLLGLARQLNSWNVERNATKTPDEELRSLSIDDVNLLKEIILTEIEKSSVKHPDVISDQILFLVIGAVQIQSQSHSSDAWKLVNKSIHSFLKPEKEKSVLSLSFAATALVIICISATVLLNPKVSEINPEAATNTATSIFNIDVAGPASLSALLTMHSKMKDGTCQLPQAAMLPTNQRQAFLSFVNDGIVDMDNVENLTLALGYVSCLYPQKLMTKPL